MKPANLLHLYWVRLRARWPQELLVLVGIAAGVALLFGSQIAADSLSSSPAELARGILGRASLQLLARSPQGFDAGLLARVRHTAGVRAAAPLLEASANVLGPRGAASAELVGADGSLKALGGTLVAHTELAPFGGIEAILLTSSLARRVGVTAFGSEASIEVAGRRTSAPLYRVLGARQVGPLVNAPVLVAPLSFAQQIAGMPGRLSRVLVEAAPGREREVARALARLAPAAGASLEPASYDQQLFSQAAAASNQSTVLFSVISALVGFLFAFNAVLLTVSQRRRTIVELRHEGYSPPAALGVLGLDAAALGVLGCILGLALGDELSIHVFASNPGYLSSAFAVSSTRVVSASAIALAVLGGMLAAALAVFAPMRDFMLTGHGLRASERDVTSKVRRDLAGKVRRHAWSVSMVLCLIVAAAIAIAAPQLAILAVVLLACALLASLPLALRGALALLGALARRFRGVTPHIARMELGASRTRALAIAATGAVAVFGTVSIEGARADLQHGLENAAHDMNAFTQLWVAPAGSFNLLVTQPFASPPPALLRRLPGVASVRDYRGSLLDWGRRRVWVIAPPAGSSPLVAPSQVLEGSQRRAERLLRKGGWAVLSQALAREHHVHLGGAFVLPAPRPTRLRLAAMSTNIGWAPGAVIVSSASYAEAWRSYQPSAYLVELAPGASTSAVAATLRRALGPSSGLAVQSAARHAATQRALTRQGLQRLTQIATLILIAAVLAMASGIGGTIWQRRTRLAKLRLDGFSFGELWATVLLESAVVLLVGCLTGAAFGLLGQQALDRALAATINYPVVPSVAAAVAVASAGAVVLAALCVLALLGRIAVRAAPELALGE